jgi:hypothetical protein
MTTSFVYRQRLKKEAKQKIKRREDNMSSLRGHEFVSYHIFTIHYFLIFYIRPETPMPKKKWGLDAGLHRCKVSALKSGY